MEKYEGVAMSGLGKYLGKPLTPFCWSFIALGFVPNALGLVENGARGLTFIALGFVPSALELVPKALDPLISGICVP